MASDARADIEISDAELVDRLDAERWRAQLAATLPEVAKQIDDEAMSEYRSGRTKRIYQASLEPIQRIDTIDGIRRGLEDMKNGKMRSAEDVFADMRQSLNPPVPDPLSQSPKA
jgi:hypothetical protein